MSEWKQKRFWKAAGVAELDGGYGVTLDGRTLRSPAKAILSVPSRALADALAAEWDAQEDVVDPRSMPLTRTANSAIDKVRIQRAEVADILADYGGTDLLCYRAEGPEPLVARQAEVWDPLLDWAAQTLNAPLNVGAGVMHLAQPDASLKSLHERVHALDHWQLAAFHDLVALSGSLVIGFAACESPWSREDLWQASRLDELWQIEQWGPDEEAAEVAALKAAAFADAARFYDLLTAR